MPYTHTPAWRHHTKRAGDVKQPKWLQRLHTYAHISATRHSRVLTPPNHALAFCAPHAHRLLPTAVAFVSYGFFISTSSIRKEDMLSRGSVHSTARTTQGQCYTVAAPHAGAMSFRPASVSGIAPVTVPASPWHRTRSSEHFLPRHFPLPGSAAAVVPGWGAATIWATSPLTC
jgi:hypothetical protein